MTNRIKELRDAAGLTQQQLGERIGTSGQQIQRLEKGERRLTTDWMAKIGAALGVEAGELLAERGVRLGPAAEGTAHQQGTVSGDRRMARALPDVPEIDVRAGAGGGGEAMTHNFTDGVARVSGDQVRDWWGIPESYLRHELRTSRDHVRMFEIRGDSMAPTLLSGDRVMVDITDSVASPDGVFALWDGIGVVVKRLEHIPNSNPTTFRIISDNPRHSAHDRTGDEINVIGRVIWVARRL